MDSAIHGPLMPSLACLRQDYPDLQVLMHRDRSETQSAYVASGRLDIAVTIQHPFQPGLDVLPLTSDPLCVVLPENHPLAAQEKIRLAQLRDERFVLGEPTVWCRYLRLINDFYARENIIPRISTEAQESPTMFELVAAGFSVTLYPDVPGVRGTPGLAFRNFVEEAPVINSYAVSRRSALPPAGRPAIAVVDEIAGKCRLSATVAPTWKEPCRMRDLVMTIRIIPAPEDGRSGCE